MCLPVDRFHASPARRHHVMTNGRPQSAKSHTRWVPLYHFVAQPLAVMYAAYQISMTIKAPSRPAIYLSLFAAAVAIGLFAARVMALTVQDRVIRLEETLRMQRVLPASMHADIAKLTRGQFVALRFASDGELAELVRRTLSGELATPKAIKDAVTNWRADWLRA